MSAALCAQVDPDIFYNESSRSSVAAAKRVCNACPLQAACLTRALETEERWGVWGGTSEVERRRMLAARGSVAA